MTKLADIGEQVIRQLDEEDEADVWAEREVYQRRFQVFMESSREVLGIKALAKVGLGAERYAPAKRTWGGPRRNGNHKPGRLERSLDIVVDDTRRIKDILRSIGRKQQRRDDKLTGELIAAERRLRLVHGKIGDGEEWEAELHRLVDKLHKRLKGSGPTGAERHRKKSKTRRAK